MHTKIKEEEEAKTQNALKQTPEHAKSFNYCFGQDNLFSKKKKKKRESFDIQIQCASKYK